MGSTEFQVGRSGEGHLPLSCPLGAQHCHQMGQYKSQAFSPHTKIYVCENKDRILVFCRHKNTTVLRCYVSKYLKPPVLEQVKEMPRKFQDPRHGALSWGNMGEVRVSPKDMVMATNTNNSEKRLDNFMTVRSINGATFRLRGGVCVSLYTCCWKGRNN